MTYEEKLMAQAQIMKMANMKGLVARANINPRSLTKDELTLANQYAQELGLDISQAKKRDVATTGEKWTAGIGGGLDALAFGIVPDKWYSSYRTEDAKNTGKMIGNVAGMLIPGAGLLKAGKGALSAIKIAKALQSADKAKGALGVAKLGFNVAKQMNKKELVALANVLLRGGGVANASSKVNTIPGLGNNPQESPFVTNLDPLGMPTK